MTEYGKKPEMMKFSKDFKTPMELSSMQSWSKDKCKFLENGKVLTKISGKTSCLHIYRTTGWHLCYIIRTNDDALIIFTAPEKGFVLDLSSAMYLKIARNETSSDRKMCKVKLKWKFGEVKLKFAENQLFIWRQRFLSTLGHIGDPNKSDTAIIRKRKNDKSDSKETEHEEEWETTESMMSLASNQFLHSYSSKSSENLKHPKNQIGSISPHSDTKKIESSLVTVHKEQLCNCHRLLGLINRDNIQHSNKEKLQNNLTKSMSATIKNNCEESVENDNSKKENSILSINAMQLSQKNYCFDEVNNIQSNNRNLPLSKKLSGRNALT